MRSIIVLLGIVFGILLVSGCTQQGNNNAFPDQQKITTFKECAEAGFPVMESYPPQCRTPDGRTFTENITPTQTSNPKSRDSSFGISGGRKISFAVDESTLKRQMAKYNAIFLDMGVELSRDDSYKYIYAWENVEPEKGRMDFAKLDAYVYSSDTVSSLAVVLPFVGWDQKSCPANTEEKCAHRQCSQTCLDQGYPEEKCCEESGNVQWKCIPCDMEAYKSFLREMVGRYKDKVKYWEILQEPDLGPPSNYQGEWVPPFWRSSEEDYVELLKASYGVIKGVCSDCIVTSAGFAGLDNSFVVKVMELGAQNYFDVFSFHHYGDHSQLENLLKNTHYEIKKDIWMTETGSIDYAKAVISGGINEEIYSKRQSEYLVKNYVAAFSLGIKKVFWHELWYESQDDKGWSYVALTDISNTKKRPAYHTYKLLREKLDYFDSAKTIKKGQYWFRFNDKKPVFVLWSDAGSATADLSGYVETGNVLVTHIITREGQTQPETETAKANSIPIGETPVFVEEV